MVAQVDRQALATEEELTQRAEPPYGGTGASLEFKLSADKTLETPKLHC